MSSVGVRWAVSGTARVEPTWLGVAERLVERRQLHEPHTVGETIGDRRGQLDGEARLADATGPHEREEPVVPEDAAQTGDLVGPAYEAGEQDRQVGAGRLS